MHIQIRDRHQPRGHLYDCANESRESRSGRRARASLVSHFVVIGVIEGRDFSLEMSPCASKVRRDHEKSRLLRNRAQGLIIHALSRGDCTHFDGDNSFRVTPLQFLQLITFDIAASKRSDDLLFRLSIFDSARDVSLLSRHFRNCDKRSALNFSSALNS